MEPQSIVSLGGRGGWPGVVADHQRVYAWGFDLNPTWAEQEWSSARKLIDVLGGTIPDEALRDGSVRGAHRIFGESESAGSRNETQPTSYV